MEIDTIKALNGITGALNTQRYHTILTHKQESVAEHSYIVAMLLQIMYSGAAPASMLVAAMYHDIAEAETGDIPSPVKRKLKNVGSDGWLKKMEDEVLNSRFSLGLPHLTSAEVYLLKLADILAAMVFINREWQLGNRCSSLISMGIKYEEYFAEVNSKLLPLCQSSEMRQKRSITKGIHNALLAQRQQR